MKGRGSEAIESTTASAALALDHFQFFVFQISPSNLASIGLQQIGDVNLRIITPGHPTSFRELSQL